MLLFKSLIVLCAVLRQCIAFEAKDVHLSFSSSNQRAIMFGKINSSTQKAEEAVSVESLSEQLELGFAVPGSEQPSQAILLLSLPEKGLEAPLRPTIVENQDLNLYKIKIDISQIPTSILYYSKKLSKPLTASLILASEGAENIFLPVFDIELNFDDIIEYTEPSRYGPKHEIRHIFNAEPTTAPWFICQVFTFATILCTFFLIVSWMASGSLNFQNIPKGSGFILFIAFISSIIGFEYIFLRYYSGSSIFETLYSLMYLGLPSLWIGTKFLRSVAEKL